MLLEQTIERLRALRLGAMADKLREWSANPKAQQAIAPAELVGLLADCEWIQRENRRLSSRLRGARLRINNACLEDLTYGSERGLSKTMIKPLMTCRWTTARENVIVTGDTGVGKSYLACALGNQACRAGFTVAYKRSRRLLDELTMARGDGTHARYLQKLAKTQVLIIDDFGTDPLSATERSDLLEIVEDRYGVSSTIVTSQRDPDHWHAVIGDSTIADAILDRLVHNAHRLKLSGPSIRKTKNGLTASEPEGKDKN
jgi:DNA replication protein DnaC